MTTVGYGDRYPVTTTGRFVAATLMVAGIALLGIVTATLASWLVERVAEATDGEQAVTRAEIENLTVEVRRLADELAARSSKLGAAEPLGEDHGVVGRSRIGEAGLAARRASIAASVRGSRVRAGCTDQSVAGS